MSDLEMNTSGMSQKEFEKTVADKQKIGDPVNLREVESIWNKRYKKNQPQSATSKFIMKVLNFGSDTEMPERKGPPARKATENKDIEKANKKSNGGSITKNRIGGNDYRKGGYVLSTVDNRKKKG